MHAVQADLLFYSPISETGHRQVRESWRTRFRVSADSFIFRKFRGDPIVAFETKGLENLASWKHSDGAALADIHVTIEVRLINKRLAALVRSLQSVAQ